MNALHIAQVNIGRMKAALEDPVMAGFVARLEEINALGKRRWKIPSWRASWPVSKK